MRQAWCTVGLVLLIAGAAAATAGPAQDRVEFAGDDRSLVVRYTAVFDPAELTFGQAQGYDTIDLPDGLMLNAPGRPRLPVRDVRIALPEGMRVTGLRVLATEPQDLPGQYVPLPGQAPQPVSAPPAPLADPDPAAYAAAEPYPAEPARLLRQSDLAGQPLALVRLQPLQYVAAERRLVLHTRMDLVLEGTSDYVCGDYLPPTARPATRDAVARRLAQEVVNPAHVNLRAGAPTTRGVAPGDYDYVIITQASWVDDFQPLADWKTKKGVPATIVTTTWIYNSGGYSGSNAEKLRAFVIDAYTTWGATYFLIGGDTNIVPCGYRSVQAGGYNENIPNDTYLGDFDNDFQCEVHVGRAAVRDTGSVATFISKVLTYEQNPPASNYARVLLFTGFDLNQYGSGEGENTKIGAYQYVPAAWTYRTEYDSEPGAHKADVIAKLNLGNNLVNHADHSSTYYMGTGSTNHGEGLENGDMSALTNGARQSILYSLGCWPCDFPATTCIAEAFVRNANGGGVAFVGNSRYGWYVPFSGDGASAHFDRYFFRSLFYQQHTTLGDCFSDHKDDAYEGDEYSDWIYTELTLLGDPELPVWTTNPATLTVSHTSQVYAGYPGSLDVQVSAGASPVPGARVCVWKAGEVYQVAQTDAGGAAHFTITPATLGTIYVTAWVHDFLPWQGQAQAVPPTSGTLTVLSGNPGNVTRDPDLPTYPAEATVTLTPAPAPGWCFDRWEGDLTGTANPGSIVILGDMVVTAVFEPDCNGNAVRDTGDISAGFSGDCNGDDVPDECQADATPGLTGSFFDEPDLAGLCRTRIDPVVSFDWGTGAPWYGFGTDTFSVRWQGFVLTPPGGGGLYTFFTRTDDGVRLWVDGQLLVDHWADQSTTERSGAITLAGDASYPLVLEYYENGGGAVAELLWQPPAGTKTVIPAESLRAGADCNVNGVPDACDFNAAYALESADFSPLGAGYVHSVPLVLPPAAAGDVTLSFRACGDLNFSSENVAVDLNGVLLGTAYMGVAISCQPEQLDTLLVPAATFNAAKGTGDAVLHLVPSSGVSPTECPESYIQVSIAYAAVPNSVDANGNGVPDECELAPPVCRGDCNCDGAVGFSDIDYFVAAIPDNAAAWAALFPGGTLPAGCTFAVCDVNASGSVGFDDIDPFVALIPSACP